jgi:hypothetical protein
MQLSEALRLVRRFEPEAMLHRDHICSESVTQDLAHCPKMLNQIYAWRIESSISRNRSVERKPHAMFAPSSAVPCDATSLSCPLETARLNTNFTGTGE